MRISDYIEDDEREALRTAGAAAFVKTATPGFISTVTEGLVRLPVLTALLTGVPIGVALHAFQRYASKKTKREREQLYEIDYYRDAASALENGLKSRLK
jgi:hypothetical protein